MEHKGHEGYTKDTKNFYNVVHFVVLSALCAPFLDLYMSNMGMGQYLIDTFLFNDQANKKLLEKIRQLPDPAEAVKYFSHLINSQNKWLKRIEVYPEDPKMDWWEPGYELDQLEELWDKSLNAWVSFLEARTEEEIFEEVKFVGFDGTTFSAALKDIGLQLNYHSIHHRAQVQTMIRKQGLEPDFLDYIATKYKRLG